MSRFLLDKVLGRVAEEPMDVFLASPGAFGGAQIYLAVGYVTPAVAGVECECFWKSLVSHDGC
jgi:hypothetical protein